jgi:CelD/BcsL family acetyltransferase involved in cellulose biosynthesis
MTEVATTIHVLRGFDDSALGPEEWARVLATGQSDQVFLTWHWQTAWWQSFARGELLLLAAERGGRIVALAPLFAEAGMVYFVGSGGSDYLDFIGDISDPEILDSLLAEARKRVRDFIGFVFYHVPETSETGRRLQEAAARLGLKLFEEGSQPAPVLAMGADKSNALEAANKRTPAQRERFFLRNGLLEVHHLADGATILPHLDDFFAQHITRWADTQWPSLFNDEKQRQFYRNVVRTAGQTGWLRFTRLAWDGRPIAFHFGFCYRGTFLMYKSSYAIDLAQRSPGQVLLRQLLLKAVDENAHTYDFGLGEEAYKSQLATATHVVRNWGLYEPTAVADKN